MFRFAYPWVIYIGIPVLLICAWMRSRFYKPIRYKYPLTEELTTHQKSTRSVGPTLLFCLNLTTLLLLVLISARPQLVDIKSKINVEGIDIMMVLDASRSMQCFDDLQDQRPRFDVAKEEALRFIAKREHDPIGLVVFGKDAVSRCPLTLDKHILKEILTTMQLGDVDPDGTVLSIAIAMGANRLKQSKAKSKVMIVLTDGEPTPGLDMDPKLAVELAKKLGIKIYTIGIGNEQGGLWKDPLFGIRAMGFKLNKQLLQYYATQTGGQFFEAQYPQDMKRIYDIIDALEKTDIETDIFTRYFDMVVPLLATTFVLLFLHRVLSTMVWFIV